jgi:hypothetical protein
MVAIVVYSYVPTYAALQGHDYDSWLYPRMALTGRCVMESDQWFQGVHTVFDHLDINNKGLGQK